MNINLKKWVLVGFAFVGIFLWSDFSHGDGRGAYVGGYGYGYGGHRHYGRYYAPNPAQLYRPHYVRPLPPVVIPRSSFGPIYYPPRFIPGYGMVGGFWR
jgi:hypothetical protein